MDDFRKPDEAPGLPVEGPPAGPAPEEEAPDFVPLRLLLDPGGAMVELDRPDMLIGRHSAADVRLPLPDVSRRHCRFVWVEGCWQVIDLNSLNGVFVNDEPVLQAPVHQGDRIRIGGFVFTADLSREPAPAPADPDLDLARRIFRMPPGPDLRRAS